MQMKNIEQGESDSDFDEDAFFDALGKWKIFLFLADSGWTFLLISWFWVDGIYYFVNFLRGFEKW